MKFKQAIIQHNTSRYLAEWARSEQELDAMADLVRQAIIRSSESGFDFRTALGWVRFNIGGRTCVAFPQAGERECRVGPKRLTHEGIFRALRGAHFNSEDTEWVADAIARRVVG